MFKSEEYPFRYDYSLKFGLNVLKFEVVLFLLENIFNKRIKWIFFVLLITPLLYFIMPSIESSLQPIPGYFNIKINSEHATAFYQQLKMRSIKTVNPYQIIETIHSYDTIEAIPISDFSKRLNSSDIRFDPYLQSLYHFFYQVEPDQTWVNFYIPAHFSSVITAIFLSTLLPHSNLVYFKSNLFFVLIFLPLVLACFILAYFFQKRFATLFLMLSLLSIPVFFTGSLYLCWVFMSSSIILYFLLFYQMTALRKYFRLKTALSRQDLNLIFLPGIALILPLFFPLILPWLPVKLFFYQLFLIISLFSAAIIFLFNIYQCERGPGYTGLLVMPLLGSKYEKSTLVITSLSFQFSLFLLLLIPMLFYIPKSPSQAVVTQKVSFEQMTKAKTKAFAKALTPNAVLSAMHQHFNESYSFHSNFDSILNSSSVFYPIFMTEKNNKVTLKQNLVVPSFKWSQYYNHLSNEKSMRQFPFLIQNNKVSFFTMTTKYSINSLWLLYRIICIINIGVMVFYVLIYFLINVKSRRRSFAFLIKEWA